MHSQDSCWPFGAHSLLREKETQSSNGSYKESPAGKARAGCCRDQRGHWMLPRPQTSGGQFSHRGHLKHRPLAGVGGTRIPSCVTSNCLKQMTVAVSGQGWCVARGESCKPNPKISRSSCQIWEFLDTGYNGLNEMSYNTSKPQRSINLLVFLSCEYHEVPSLCLFYT